MKKIIALLLALTLVLSLASCKKSETKSENNQNVEVNKTEESVVDKPETPDSEPKDESIPTEDQVNTETDKKEETATEEKPSAPEQDTQKPSEPATTDSTVGQTLLADFKAKASSHSNASSLAEAISTNPVLPFPAALMPVEPGLLSGFGNTEINGFKEGVMFAPFIGSIPFVGYVFILEDGVSASSFISTLEENADLRWNICVEADEKISGHSGNKVFFVMSPKNFEQE